MKLEGRIDVVPIYLSSTSQVPATKKTDTRPDTVGFVAKDFAAKGGSTLLEAFKIVRSQLPEARLTIVGCEPTITDEEAKSSGIDWIPYVPREKLLGEVFPTFDVFAYPTRFDGQPLVILEALAQGVPIAISDYQAMPEMVDFGRAGLISPVGNAATLASNILFLLEPANNQRYRHLSRAWFEMNYSAEAVRPKLRAAYDRALVANQQN